MHLSTLKTNHFEISLEQVKVTLEIPFLKKVLINTNVFD